MSKAASLSSRMNSHDSNIFIVKPDGAQPTRTSADPHRHEPATQRNIGQIVLRGIRCTRFFKSKLSKFVVFFRSILGDTTN